VVVVIVLFMLGMQAGPGPVMWVMLAEIFPNAVRGAANGFAVMILWITNMLVTFLFPVMMSGLGPVFTYALFAAINIFAVIWYYVRIPETRKFTLERIEWEFREAGRVIRPRRPCPWGDRPPARAAPPAPQPPRPQPPRSRKHPSHDLHPALRRRDRRRHGRQDPRQRLAPGRHRLRPRPAPGAPRRDRRRPPPLRRGRRGPLRLRGGRRRLARCRRGRLDRHRLDRGGQCPAPRDRRGHGRRRQARAVREAARRHPRGRRGDGGARAGAPRPGARHRLHLPPQRRGRDAREARGRR